MIRLLQTLFILTFLSSCAETYRSIDSTVFNAKIAGRTDIKTPEDLIKLFYSYPVNEGTPKLTVETTNSGDSYKITLVHRGMEDDSQSDLKIVMKATLTGQNWVVSDIRENWKCRPGRGHTGWGTEFCN